jgi:hypothetical protein
MITRGKISEIDFDSYSIDLKNFDRVENGFLYADEKTTFELFGKVYSKIHNNEEFGILHSRLIKASIYIQPSLLTSYYFKIIKNPMISL